jgi:5'-nucleotidase
MPRKPQILLTNDDGILSPGLWAAAEALSALGFVTVAAPREQSSGAGRSLPATSDGIIRVETVEVHGQQWQVYAIGGTPAQAVLHAVLEIMPDTPDLLVSGINYGENMSTGITASGTVGAALEAASLGIPSIAISVETRREQHLSYSTEVDFSASAHFAAFFGGLLLERGLPEGVDVLKVDVPSDATPQTAWQWTRLSRQRYYKPAKPERASWDVRGAVGYDMSFDFETEPEETDVYTLLKKRLVSVTPLTLDLTAGVDFHDLEGFARSFKK